MTDPTLAQLPAVDWNRRPLAHLVLYIEGRYHRPFDAEVARMIALIADLVADEPRLGPAMSLLTEIREHMREHMAYEEAGLHQWVLTRPGEPVPPDLHDESAHAEVIPLLLRLSDLVGDLSAVTTGSARLFVATLAGLEESLGEHLDLENNVLHPRLAALAQSRRTA